MRFIGQKRHLAEIIAAPEIRQNLLFSDRLRKGLESSGDHDIKRIRFSPFFIDGFLALVFDQTHELTDGLKLPLIQTGKKRAQRKEGDLVYLLKTGIIVGVQSAG